MQKLAEICVRRPVFATMLILALTVIGAFSVFTLGLDRFPNIDFPIVTVQTVNPGASPEEIERDITDIIEGSVNTVSGIDDLRSVNFHRNAPLDVWADANTLAEAQRRFGYAFNPPRHVDGIWYAPSLLPRELTGPLTIGSIAVDGLWNGPNGSAATKSAMK